MFDKFRLKLDNASHRSFSTQADHSDQPPVSVASQDCVLVSTKKSISLWQRYRHARKRTQFSLGCGSMFLALLLCTVMATTSMHADSSTQDTTVLATVPVQTTATEDNIVKSTAPTTISTPISVATSTLAPVSAPTVLADTSYVQATKVSKAPARKGVYGNPWGYDFNLGKRISSPPSAFCNYFKCISTFWNGHGYVVQCADQMFSKSGGVRGSCSRHGGNMRTLYAH